MNIAFPTLTVLLLVLPGVLFSYFYRRGFWRSPVTFGPVTTEVAKGVLLALVLHWIGVSVVEYVVGTSVNWSALLSLLTGQMLEGSEKKAIVDYVDSIFAYILLSNTGGIVAGGFVHKFVRSTWLDLRWDFFNFNNQWYYLFSGEARVFSSQDRSYREINKYKKDVIELVFISAVVEQNDESYLYWGVLSDYFFNSDGKLDRVVLQATQRRILNEASKESSTVEGSDTQLQRQLPPQNDAYYDVVGDFFILPYSEVKNINIEYWGETDPESRGWMGSFIDYFLEESESQK